MSHCPSHDWDRYCDEEEKAAEAERQWWVNNGDRVLQVCCAVLGNPTYDSMEPEHIIIAAEELVRMITDKQADPYV